MNLYNQLKKFKFISIYIYLFIYGILSYILLSRFPLVHSDEPWLAGMTEAYLNNKSLFVTESFFDLVPRTVHTIKSLYHLIQIPFISVFGYTITGVRMPSLIAGLITLYIFYRLIRQLYKDTLFSLLITILLSLNLQFIYASHFARQEMLLCLSLVIAYSTYIKSPLKPHIPGLIIGISIALHPNAFIIGCMIGILILRDTLLKKQTYKGLLTYILILSAFALFHLSLTLIANPDFFQQYFAYGKTLNVDASPFMRLQNFSDFYLKLYYQVTGTYYIPPQKMFFNLYAASLILAILVLLITKATNNSYQKQTSKSQLSTTFIIDSHFSDPIFMVIAFNIGIYIIGRYNTTSFLFLIFPFYLLLSHLFFYFKKLYMERSRLMPSLLPFYLVVLSSVLIFGSLSISSLYNEIYKLSRQDYDGYSNEISTYIQDDSVILGNLSSGFAFKNNRFYDIRNLNYLNNSTIEEYVRTRQINTIIYYEEYDYIQRNPMWSILYGDNFNPSELKDFLNEKATLSHTFTDMYYGSRIIRYMGDYPWTIYIYTLEP